MIVFSEIAYPVCIGFAVTFVAGVLISLTRSWHGMVTFDTLTGPQKFHDTSTSRVGGLAVFTGFLAAATATASPIYELLFVFGISSIPAFVGGLAEDCTKRVSPTWRFLTTILSALIFCLFTGCVVSRIEIPAVDSFMGFQVVSIPFTVFAVASLAHAVNIIDGFHGLATGAGIILLCAFAVVASMAGDHDLVLLIVVIIAVLSGFLLINFPFGYVFLGDGGAYFIGLLLAYIAVMLPERNPDISPWVSVLVLAYPLIEIWFSIFRKTVRRGHQATRPDKVHLHMLVYRSFAKRIAKALKNERFANPAASVLMWGGPMTSLVFVLLIPLTREWSLLALSLQMVLYFFTYRRVSLQGRNRVLQRLRNQVRGCKASSKMHR